MGSGSLPYENQLGGDSSGSRLPRWLTFRSKYMIFGYVEYVVISKITYLFYHIFLWNRYVIIVLEGTKYFIWLYVIVSQD